jgi:hypothetical protein
MWQRGKSEEIAEGLDGYDCAGDGIYTAQMN